MPEKDYLIVRNGESQSYSAEDFNHPDIQNWLGQNKDAQSYEVSAYNDQDETLDGDFFQIYNEKGEHENYSREDFEDPSVQAWVKQNPKARIARVRPVGPWGDELRKQYSHQRAINDLTGNRPEAGPTDEQRAQLDAKRQRIADLQSQLDNYNKKASEEMGAITTQQGRLMKQPEQEKKRSEIRKQLEEAEKAYYTDPIVLGENERGAQAARMGNEELEKIYSGIKDQKKASGQQAQTFGGSSIAAGGAPAFYGEDEDQKMYNATKRLNDAAIRLREAPSKYDPQTASFKGEAKEKPESGFNNFMKGAKDRVSEADFWTLGLTGIQDQLQLKEVFDKIRTELGGMNEITEENIEQTLSPMEKQLLAAFFRNADAQAARANDLSRGYQAGQSAADSLQFMAQFALSGAVTGAAAKALSKSSVSSMSEWIAKAIAKEGAGLGKQAFGRVVGDVVEGAAGALFQPGAYKSALEAMNQLDENGEIVNQNKAFWKGLADYGIEVFSERTGDYIPNVLGALTKTGKIANLTSKLANTELGKWGRAFYNSDALRMLKAGGWNGYFGEMSEEFIGAALRSATGLDKDAWKEQWDRDNLAVMALSFLPMSIFGGTVNTVKYGAARKNLAESQEKMPAILQGLGFNEDQIAHAMDVTQMSTPEKIRETIKPIVDEMADRGATKQDRDALMDYAMAAATVNAYDGFESEKVQQQRNATQAELQSEYGDFWQGNEKSGRTVQRVTLPDGRSGFVLNTDETGLMSVRFDDGTYGYTDTAHGAQVDESSLDSYLDSVILTGEQAQDAARMQEEAAAARQQFNNNLAQNADVPMGTPERQEVGKLLTQQDPNTGAVTPIRDANGNYIVATMNGQTPISENDLAAKWGIKLQPETREQLEADAVAEYEASKKRVDAYNTIPRGSTVEANLEGLEEPVPYQFTRAVYNDETGEVEIKVWDEENQREETLPESAFPDLQQAAAQYSTPQPAAQAPVAAEAPAADNTPRDFRGNPLPLKDDGRVNQGELWEKDPEAWAAWNDQQRQDGGANTRAYIEGAKKDLEKDIATLQKAYANERDFDKRDAIEQEIARKQQRLSSLDSIAKGYETRANEAAKAEKEAGKKRDEAIPAEQSQGELGPEYQVNGAQPAEAKPTPEQQVAEKNDMEGYGPVVRKIETKKGTAEVRTKVTEKDGIRTTKVVTIRNGEEITSAQAVPLPKGYKIKNGQEFSEDSEVLGITELRESKDGRAAATFLVKLPNGSVAQLNAPLEIVPTEAAPTEQKLTPEQQAAAAEEQRRVPLRARAQEWAEKTGVPVELIESPDQVTDADAVEALRNGIRIAGWYNKGTGKVCIYLPNITDESEIDRTYIHEVISHKGLADMLGAGYNSLLDHVWSDLMTDAQREKWTKYVKATNKKAKGAALRRAAADEYIADLSERIGLENVNEEELSDWKKFVRMIYQFFMNMVTGGVKVTEQDLSDLLVASMARYKEIKENGGAESLMRATDENGAGDLNTASLARTIQDEMAEKGLVMDGGVVMDEAQDRLKKETGYKTPNELDEESNPITGEVRFSITTMEPWERNYMQYPGAEQRVVDSLERLVERMTADELVYGVVPTGTYKYGEKSSGSFAGPLRTNIEYVVTFDMDTSCPRSLQYLAFVKKIERKIGRPLTQTESVQLIEMMRVYGQMIPCVYCYCENKRQALKQYYTDFMTAHHGVLSAKTEEQALKAMYGHVSGEKGESNDPAVALTAAAYKVFKEWRKEKKYNPTIKQLWSQYRNDRNVALTILDDMIASGKITTQMNDEAIAKILCDELRVTNPKAQKTLEEIVSDWKWDRIEDKPHDDFTRVENEDDLVVGEDTLALWRDMTLYGKSASSAKNTLRYVPYTDELKTLRQEDRDYINGMAGLRMHSSNDFRIDYVLDYFQFMADMAVNKMLGHTYTKSPEFVRIFGNSGYKINMSIAAYEDSHGIRPNAAEGFDWDTAKELRLLFPNAGTMLMATSDAQLQFALDNDWVDMCILFHRSGLPKAIWKDMRAWTDYESKQNERFLNSQEMADALKADGVEIPKGAKAATIEKLYFEHFNITVVTVQSGKDKGKRIRPHFLPGPTRVGGVEIPGHNNDYETYIRLCREYGVHPRFEGIRVKDNTPEGGGREVDVTQHPRYMILVKETARTDTPQTPIEFNFDQPSEALGGKTPIDYAFEELEARAMAESQMAGGPVRDIYESYNQDPYGIVDQFIDGIIKHKEETGEDYPLDYLTPDSRKWFMTERRALEDAYKDFDTIPYHPHEYDENGNLIMEPEDQEQPEEQPKTGDQILGEILESIDRKNAEAEQTRFRMALEDDLTNDGYSYGDQAVLDGYGLEAADLRRRDDVVTLQRLIAKDKGQGAGTRFMNDLTELADKNDWVLALTPTKDLGASSVSRLKEFYKRFGFKENKGRNADLTVNESMIRQPEGTEIRFSIRGITGAQNADDQTALDNLAVATLMEDAGKDPVTIWKATGWEIGADGKWRNEIPDAKQKEGIDLGKTQRAGDILDAPELFDSYPQLKELPIELVHTESAGSYSPKKNKIEVDADYNTTFESDGSRIFSKEGMRTILHELQHAIQHIEGFARGGGEKGMETEYYNNARKDNEELANFAYLFSRRNSSRKLNLVGREGVIRQMEKFDISRYNDTDKRYFANILTRLKNMSDEEFRVFVRDAARLVKDAQKAGSSGYKRLAGEVEARNVEQRSKVPFDARRKHPLFASEDVPRHEQIIRFRVSNEDQKIFISNAEKAVSDLKMDKATPEQWKKTLEKNGGLKAAEDKWLGLSDWLDGLDRKTVTKQEVLDFIAENQIQIEEQRYSEDVDLMRAATEDVRNTIGRGKELEELQAEVDELVASEEYQAINDDEEKDEWLLDQMKERYGDDFEVGYFIDEEQKIDYALQPWDIDQDDINSRLDVRRIEPIRLGYTTEGLRNRQEIALTIPTIESWNESDKTHFGDAGQGRAIAWARFGDTFVSSAKDESERKYREADKAFKDYRDEIVKKYAVQATGTKTTRDLATPEENAKVKELQLEASRLYHEWQYGNHPREKVLVIDEIQSKRHQEAREQGGYKDDSALKKARARLDVAKKAVEEYANERYKQYGEENTLGWTREEKEEYNRLYREYRDAQNIVTRNGFDPMEDEEYRRLKAEQDAFENGEEFQRAMAEWRRDMAKEKYDEYMASLLKKYGNFNNIFENITPEENAESIRLNSEFQDANQSYDEASIKERRERLKSLQQENRELLRKMQARENELAEEFNATHKSTIPAAPFEKNWHELTMKRMLRYAAENGYEKVAWTTGEQQADRYSLGGMVSKIEVSPVSDGTREVTIESSGADIYLDVDDQGVIVGQQDNYGENLRGKKLSDVVGKEMAVKIMGVTEDQTIEGDGLRVGGEGMKGFYDDILPRFMNKYGKKWGVKVEDIFLPALGEEQKGLTMHSVPVTEEMKESVMQGQLMFRKAMEEDEKESKELFDAAKERFGTTRDLHEAGYVLPDGAMLDFSGRHMASGDTSYLNGSRTVDHRDIEDLNFERDLNTPSGRNTNMADFIGRGAIRIHMPGMINLAVKPTPEQASVLERLINADNSFVRVEFGNGYNSEHYADYDDARPRRVLNDINRYFDEGYIPAGNTMFRITPEQDKEYLDAVESGDMDKAREMLDRAAEAAGYTIKAMHGGPYRFNVFDKDRLGQTTDADSAREGFFFTNDEDLADDFATMSLENEDFDTLMDIFHEGIKSSPMESVNEYFETYRDDDDAYEDYVSECEDAGVEPSDEGFLEQIGMMEGDTTIEDAKRNYLDRRITDNVNSGIIDEWDVFRGELEGLGIGIGHTQHVYLKIENPLIDNNERDYFLGGKQIDEPMTKVIRDAKRDGHDGVIFTDIREGGQSGYSAQYVVFEPEQAKSADVVERDDDGHIIPISKRFDESNPDIRFRVTPEQDAEYMEAVNAGDMDKAGQMVESAARAAGYDSPKLYHGSDAFGFTRIDTSMSDDRASFWATNKENVAGSYTKLSVTRKPGSEISEEEYEKAVEVADNALDEEIRKFRSLIDKYFSEWFFGDGGNDGIRHEIMGANHIPGYGDGVYDVLEDYVAEAFRDYGEDYEEEYEDFADWEENSPEAQKIFDSISSLEGLRNQLWEIKNGDLTGGIYELYANTENMFVVDADGKAWNELHPEGLPKIERGPFKDVPYRTRDVVKWAKENGYDGVIFKNIKDNGQYGRTAPSDVYAFLNPQGQVKSADPVTYDDQGNVIPLSERFNPGNNDIRFRVGSENINAGINALEKLANGEEVVRDAMSRPDLSQYGADANVAFYWGETGDPSRNYKKGYGIAHMGAKHGPESIFRALDIIDHGEIERYVEGNKTVVLTDGEYEALLALTRSGRRETWLFNGWEKKENAGETSEVSTQSGSTQTNPTFSREDLGAAVSEYKDRINSDNTNSSEEIFISDEPMTATAPEVEESAIRFRKVEDPAKIEELENGPKVKVYRSMQEIDGKLYPPMSARVNGELRQPTELGVWEESEENPDLADENGNFKLDKGNGKTLKAAYAPYFHSRRSPLNEQFSEAYNRPNLVIVEGEIPESELTSGYTAEKSKKSVGEHDWPSGKVSNALAKNGQDTRKVILSRWFKPVRVVPNSEVADMIVERMGDSEIAFPYNVVTPELRQELAKRGIKFDGWQGNKPNDMEEQIARMQAENEQASGGIRFRLSGGNNQGVYRGRPFWCGSVNLLDGEIEEVHTYEEAESAGFHHSNYFSDAQVEKIDDEECGFFWIADGDVQGEWRFSVPASILDRVRDQIQIRDSRGDGDTRFRIADEDRQKAAAIVSDYDNQDGESIPWMYASDVFDRFQNEIPYGAATEDLYALIDRYNRLDEEDLAEGRRDFSGAQRDKVFDDFMDALREFAGEDNGTRFRTADDLVKRVQDYGLRGILDEDAAKAFWADAYAVMPEDARKEIVDNAFSADADKQDLNIRREVRKYIAALAKKGYAEDGSGLLRHLADRLKEEIGEDLDENTLRYLIWRSANRYNSSIILNVAEDIAMRRRLGVGEYAGDQYPQQVIDAMNEAGARAEEANAERNDVRKASIREARKTPYEALSKAMTAQRKYDQETVASIVALAKDMIKKGNIDKVSAREMARLMTIIKDANGRKPATVKTATLQLLDFMVDHTIKKEKELLDNILKVKTAKVREPGVDTIAKLDVRTQNVINAFRDNYQLSEEEIDKAIKALEDNLDDRRFSETSLEDMRSKLEGLQLAKQYAEEIAAKEADIKTIRDMMEYSKAEFDGLTTEEKRQLRTARNEEVAADYEVIRNKKIEQVEAYRRLRGDIAKAIAEGADRAQTFLERERERVEQIHHWANSDMQGVPDDVDDRELKGWAKFINSSFAKFFTGPLANLDQMLRTLGRRTPEGRGYLWNWMMGAVRQASNTEKLGIDAAEKKLNDKVKEIFDEPDMEWNDLYSMERNMPKATMRYFSANGKWVEKEMTQGNLLYIYMVNKMADGRMKLRRMNISDEKVEEIKKALDPRFVELADWIQEEFLPGLRDRYNETHKRLFGTSMASIENYFPLRILGGVVDEKRNVGDQEQRNLPTDITGAIIKRVVNTKQLNLPGTDAFSLVVEHVREMEHWNAYAEASHDFSTLLKYKRFQNQLKQLDTIYGAGQDLLNLFWDTVNLSVGAFRPKTTPTDKAFLNLAKGVTAAKISFRAYTAIKQILSWPAFLADTNPLILGKNTLPINWKKNWDWAMENLPNFKKRVESRKAGLDILEDTSLDSKFWGTDFAKWINQNGMFMNAFVDALTVSIGARSVYETRKARYMKEGFSEEEADKKAKMDAEVAYNETQQSSEKEFMSTMQAHRTVANVALSAYRNSSMGYQRQLHQALRTLNRMSRKGYKSEAIEYMTKQLEREGLPAEDAEKAATSRYERAGWQALVRVAVFGWLVQFAWNLGSHAVYLLFGDDPDEKKAMLAEDATHALIGGPIEGLAAGNVVSEAFNMIKNGESLRNWDPTTLPIMSDIKSTISKMSSDPVAAANDLVYLAVQIGLGTNPQTISDAIVAIVDACNGDFETAREVMFCIMRILAVPQSQLDQLMIDEIGMSAKDARELSYEDIAKRYVDYKMKRNAPVTGPLYDEELRKKREKSLKTTFKKKVNEREKLKLPKE